MIGSQDAKIYNWLAVNSNQIRRNRNQAMRIVPLLAPLIARGPKCGMPGNMHVWFVNNMEDAIDNQKPLIEGLQAALSAPDSPFPKTAAKFMIRFRRLGTCVSVKDDLYPAIKALGVIDPTWHPKNSRQWRDFRTCVKAVHKFSRAFPSHTYRKYLSDTGGKWSHYADLIGRHGDIEDVMDYQRAIFYKTVMPAMINSGLMQAKGSSLLPRSIIEEYSSAIFGGCRFGKVLEASALWHKEIEELDTKIRALSLTDENRENGGLLSWLPLSETVQAPNGIWLRPLVNESELKDQGESQGHCVGGYNYVSACMTSNSHIIALSTDRDNKNRLTTVEMAEAGRWEKPDQIKVRVSQHQGHGRRRPAPEERAAIDWYTDKVNNGNDPRLKPEWDKIVARKERAKENLRRMSYDRWLAKNDFTPRLTKVRESIPMSIALQLQLGI
jgi:hypothetical protein